MGDIDGKSSRQAALVRLLQSEAVSSQDLVVQRMRDKGFEVTQPSVSRDFRELGVVKISGRYLPASLVGVSDKDEAESPSMGSLVGSIEAVGPNLVVVKTTEGAANAVGAQIDKMSIDGMAGTVAGDDTLFVAASNKRAQSRIIRALRGLG